MRSLFALLLLVAAASAQEGTWDVKVERPANWTPRVAHARLTLTKSGRSWAGYIQFEMLMNGQRMKLADIRVSRRRFSFRWDVERFQVTMEGKRDGGNLKGVCKWQGTGTWPFTAEPAAAAKEVRRLDSDARNYLPTARPETVGADPAALDRLIVAASKCDTDALLVIKDGKLICERYFSGHRGRIHIMSVTKFVTSLAVAQLMRDKQLDIDAPLSKWFPEWGKGDKAKVTMRHLMAHTSGLVHEPEAHTLNKQTDKVAYVRKLAVKAPGSRVSYSNEGIALLSGVLTRVAGKPVDAYMKEKLFGPLMIRDWKWDRDKAGHTITYAQLYMTARDLARLGLYTIKFPVPAFAKPGLRKHRGLIWRLYQDPKGHGHTGWLGQFLVVYPEHQLVGVRLRRVKNGTEFDNLAHGFGAFAGLLGDLVR